MGKGGKGKQQVTSQLSGQLEFSCSFLDRPLFIDLVTYKVIAWHCQTNQAARWPVANENDKGNNISSPPTPSPTQTYGF